MPRYLITFRLEYEKNTNDIDDSTLPHKSLTLMFLMNAIKDLNLHLKPSFRNQLSELGGNDFQHPLLTRIRRSNWNGVDDWGRVKKGSHDWFSESDWGRVKKGSHGFPEGDWGRVRRGGPEFPEGDWGRVRRGIGDWIENQDLLQNEPDKKEDYFVHPGNNILNEKLSRYATTGYYSRYPNKLFFLNRFLGIIITYNLQRYILLKDLFKSY